MAEDQNEGGGMIQNLPSEVIEGILTELIILLRDITDEETEVGKQTLARYAGEALRRLVIALGGKSQSLDAASSMVSNEQQKDDELLQEKHENEDELHKQREEANQLLQGEVNGNLPSKFAEMNIVVEGESKPEKEQES
nr:uncharacterized protein LOC109172746 isoform X2 [Ipomoea batatas]